MKANHVSGMTSIGETSSRGILLGHYTGIRLVKPKKKPVKLQSICAYACLNISLVRSSTISANTIQNSNATCKNAKLQSPD